MRNPRRVRLSPELIAEHQLSTAPPPAESIFWTLWSSSHQTPKLAQQTKFVQGIKSGALDPVVYGGFNVGDAYYCFNGAEDYRRAARRADDPTLHAFLMAKHESYEKYNTTFPRLWHVKDGSSIVPTDICKQYSRFETEVASKELPIYSLIVMLPCEYLWAWLAQQLSPPASGNLYTPWITGNDDPDGAYAMGNFLDSYLAAHPDSIDLQKAIDIYDRAIEYEWKNFAAALP